MPKSFKEFIRYAIVPIILLVIFLSAFPVYYLSGLPPDEELVEMLKEFYLEYGYWVVLIGAIIEGALFINWYLPGSIVVVLGVVFAKEAGLNPAIVVGLIIFGFLITAIFNYALGRYGWYKIFLKLGLQKPLERIKKRTERFGLQIIFSTYIHPNLGALTATSAGILELPFKRFFHYSLMATIAWNTLWGVIVYFSGPLILNLLSFWGLVFFAAAWIIFLAIKYLKKKELPPAGIP